MLRAEPAAGDRGRSRFSKALPTPPSALDAPPSFDASRPPTKQLPSVPSIPKLLARKPIRKPVVPTQTLQVDKPLPASHSQPAPPLQPRPEPPSQLHSQPAKSPLPPPPPPMSIPRRPVLPPKAETPASLPSKPEPLPSDAPPASPTDSIGSLLSAYSRSSAGESIIRSSDGAGSQRYSGVTMSPQEEVRSGKREGLPSLATVPHDNVVSKQQVRDAGRDAPVDKGLPPPPAALHDSQRPLPPRKDSVRAPPSGGSTTAIVASSPPRDQLWRRRSGKSDRDIQMPDLKLTISHGSTAASQLPSHAPHAPQVPSKDTKERSSHNQSSINPASHPAQTDFYSRPPAPAPALAAPQGITHPARNENHVDVNHNSDNMGNEASKLTTKLSHLNLRDLRNARSQHQEPGNLTSMSDTVLDQGPRLPTPEYQSQDVQTPLVDGVVSPLSPAPSPRPPQEEHPAGPKPQAKPSIQRKAIGGRDLHGVKSLPQIRTQSPPTTSADAFPPLNSASAVRDPAARASSPEQAASAQPPNPSQQQQGFRPRTSSRSQQPRPAGLPQPGQGGGPPMLREQKSQTSSLRSPRPGMQHSPDPRTFPELRVEDLPPPNPAALRFPATVVTPAPPGTVFPALPIRPSMIECHQKHRIINRSRQKNYAVACQTCLKADREDRWKCVACDLRMCDGCFHFMNGHGRDLNKLAEYLEANPGDMPAPPTPVALQYPPRPGTGMSQYAPSRPGTSMSQHAPRPGTSMSQRA